mmetsp:Transcript_44044/g.89000  ORF Transcript_44044/g.89000 Transcript_44044/m.89000 type:complete len:160 (-) Transcript_44044:304-783(-)|eukprot:CAMPEP_0171918326 /NCGR_PEP_ID=MMETSP0993-20121228/17022_1 /TAXON_ID=483369 /ORGANISM="non described non described, Strain CCMP2098" /LENGTH=159 /DNA_ID=CAMNT_0012554585 /DNA_START=22 /DNA_END=501 /DNA_ORIENTATION=-
MELPKTCELDAWDDDAIVKAFNHAMKTHRTTRDTDSMPEFEEPSIGSWHEVNRKTCAGDAAQSKAEKQPDSARESSSAVPSIPISPAMTNSLPPMMAPPSMPMPPPPLMPPMPPGAASDDEALSDLLLAWYYSGYYTGRYQATMDFKRLQQHHQQQQSP